MAAKSHLEPPNSPTFSEGAPWSGVHWAISTPNATSPFLADVLFCTTEQMPQIHVLVQTRMDLQRHAWMLEFLFNIMPGQSFEFLYNSWILREKTHDHQISSRVIGRNTRYITLRRDRRWQTFVPLRPQTYSGRPLASRGAAIRDENSHALRTFSKSSAHKRIFWNSPETRCPGPRYTLQLGCIQLEGVARRHQGADTSRHPCHPCL